MNVLILDDSKSSISMLKSIIDAEEDINVVGYSGDLPSAERAVSTLPFDLIISEVSLHGKSLLSLIADINRNFDDKAIIIFTEFPYKLYQVEFLRVGVNDFLDKHSQLNSLLTLLRNYAKHYNSHFLEI